MLMANGRSFLLCGIFLQLWAFGAQPVPLTGQLANTSIPPGGTAQLQVFLSSPMALTSGSAHVTLDPAIFGNVIAADAYSVTGDQVGSANIPAQTVDIEFTSVTGGLGRRPDLPVFSITVPVLATAQPGTTFTLTVSAGMRSWLDTQGVPYSFSVASGTLTVGGSASITNVGIVGGVLAGLLPAGTVVEIDGTGFTNATVASIDGVAIAATQFISPKQIDVILAGSADLDRSWSFRKSSKSCLSLSTGLG
jgi:hypothetical protein